MRITKEARCAKNAREYIGNRLRLVEGKIYTLNFRQQAERSERHTVIKKRMRFLKTFPHHALFENPYGIEKVYEAKEEKERIEKEFAEISQEKQMLILLTRTAEPYEATDYYGHYKKGMKCLRDFYRLLQQMGFSFQSLEELKILNGTHELYTQETEDEH